MTYETIVKALLVKPPQDPIFSEMATEIYLDDEGAGLFVTVEQRKGDGNRRVQICKEEWPQIRAAIDQLMGRC